jgi:hypothetical protein
MDDEKDCNVEGMRHQRVNWREREKADKNSESKKGSTGRGGKICSCSVSFSMHMNVDCSCRTFSLSLPVRLFRNRQRLFRRTFLGFSICSEKREVKVHLLSLSLLPSPFY